MLSLLLRILTRVYRADPAVLSILAKQVAPRRARLAVGTCVYGVSSLLFATIPLCLRGIVRAAETRNDSDVASWCIAMVAVVLVGAVFLIYGRLSLLKLFLEVREGLRSDLFEHVLSLGAEQVMKLRTGDVQSRLQVDVARASDIVLALPVAVAEATLAFVAIVAAAIYLSPMVATAAFAPVLMVVGIGFLSSPKMLRLQRAVQAGFGEALAVARELLVNVDIVRSFGAEPQYKKIFAQRAIAVFRREARHNRVHQFVGVCVAAAAPVGTVAVLAIGSWQVISAALSIADLVALLAYVSVIVFPIAIFGGSHSMIQGCVAALSRIYGILSLPPLFEPTNAVPAEEVPRAPEIRVVELTMGQPKPVLDGLSLTLEGGTTTAIVGRSGAGKTTLLRHILGLMNVPADAIFFAGIDCTRLAFADLRPRIGFVEEKPSIFSGTVYENVVFGREGVGADAFAHAIEIAQLQHDLERLPDGANTYVGERGVTLSGGQRARIALARCIAGDPDVVIIDDTLSAVDARTARRIVELLSKWLHGRTAIVSTHRLTTARELASRTVVIAAGKIAASGTHEKLISENGWYAEQVSREELGIELD